MTKTKRKSEKLYNVVFSLWLLWAFPPFIFITVPLNWIWDAAVLCIILLILKRKDLFSWRLVAKVFGIGYLSNFIATGFLFVMMMWVPYVRNYHYEICYAAFKHWCSAVVMIAALVWRHVASVSLVAVIGSKQRQLKIICVLLTAAFRKRFWKAVFCKQTHEIVAWMDKALAMNRNISKAM